MPTPDRPAAKPRPVYLNLVAIRLPLPGIVSILHRISGAALFLLGIPLGLYALQASLGSPESFGALKAAFGNPLVKLVALGFCWAYFHHFAAGVRFLLLDAHIGDELPAARRSSVIVLVVSLAVTALVGVRLW